MNSDVNRNNVRTDKIISSPVVRIGVPVATTVALLVAWVIVTTVELVPAFVLPSPQSVVRALTSDFDTMVPHIVVTLRATLYGLGIATIAAIMLTFLMAVSVLVRTALYPLLVVSQTIPLIALAPLFVIWFGFGLLPKVLVVALVCFFPVVINLMEGVAAVDSDTVNLLRSMGAGPWQLFSRAHVPASIPALFSGLRIAATYSVMGAVIGEWLGGSSGLGVYMIRAQRAFALERVFAAIAVIVVLSLVIFGLIVLTQRIVSPWRSVTGSGATS